MKAFVIAAVLTCMYGSTATAIAQFYAVPYGYGAPMAYGYGIPYPIGRPYVYDVWPYYLDTGAGPLGPFVAPPLYVPAENLGFGPQAVRRFMGLDPVRPPVINNILIAPRGGAADNAANRALGDNAILRVPPANPRVRESNAEARERARQFVEFGDAQFKARNLAGAYDRYKKAAESAPDVAHAWFRQGHVLADLGRYNQAAASFRRGLSLRPDWPASGFELGELYGDNLAARAAMFEAIERALEARAEDVNVQYVAAVQLFFDGRPEQARTSFERARKLGEPASFIEPYLKALAPGELDI